MAKKIYSPDWLDYELLDAGGEKKLERWGEIITIRPERQAYFRSGMPFTEWAEMAHLEFIESNGQTGKWKILKEFSEADWQVNFQDLSFNLETTKFKHVGLFPEQASNWQLISKHLNPGMKMLNLFAYTGAASIVGRATGAEVTHVDSVKQLISWAKTNMEASGLENIRWIHDDALKFAQKEIKRGNHYDLIVMDPPAWGIGANKEKWKIEDKLAELIENASELLSPNGLLILNTYSPKVNLEDIQKYAEGFFKEVEVGELWKKTTTKKEMFFGHLLRGYK